MSIGNRFAGKLGKKDTPKSESVVDVAPVVEPSTVVESRPVGRPKTGKSSNPNYVQATLYLPRELYGELKIEAIRQDKEVSDLAELAIRNLLEKNKV